MNQNDSSEKKKKKKQKPVSWSFIKKTLSKTLLPGEETQTPCTILMATYAVPGSERRK